ncbi:hypothetical protein QEN19_000310 [Hanseniaspora menglaensis]
MSEESLNILAEETSATTVQPAEKSAGDVVLLHEGDAVQVINDDQMYNEKDVVPFINKLKDDEYHVISIFGSQSSGKSTLLNHLFDTKFQTMNEQIKRGQTTKGIWMSSRKVTLSKKNLLIMDVEGSDGVEKSDDKDFERKACLFALSSSEVLIINVWEHQIGLYQGNNMELLKIVFEVNLQLFHGSQNEHKVLLLFIIRDHIGMTPLKSLKETMCNELDKMWEQIKKPLDLQDSKFTDFFDLEFKGFSHYFLQNDKFLEDCVALRNEFDSESIFNSNKYKLNKTLPLDGWELYSQNCWNVISSSEQLDLPTQQILVAKFKTKEISDGILQNYKSIAMVAYGTKDFNFKNLAEDMTKHLNKFDEQGGRYTESVYLEEKISLLNSMQELNYNALSQLLDEEIHENIILKNLQIKLQDKKIIKEVPSFMERSISIKNDLISEYNGDWVSLLELNVINSDNNEKLIQSFTSHINKVLELENKKESLKIKKKINKDLFKRLNEYLEVVVSKPDTLFWDGLKEFYRKTVSSLLKPFGSFETGYEFPLNFNETEHKDFIIKLASSNQKTLNKAISELTSVQKLALILEEQYKNIFLIDPENQTPRFFENMTISEMETLDTKCKNECESWLQLFAKGLDYSAFNYHLYSEDFVADFANESSNEDESDYEEFLDGDSLIKYGILSDLKKTKVLQEFNKKIQLINLQTKRTILQSRANTKIPPYIYALLFFLGYSKIIYVLKNPLWILTLLILGSSWIFVHRSGQYKFVFMIVQKWIDMVKQIIISKLREFLDETNNSDIKKPSSESYELDNLSKKNSNE